jgi:hypothetical protein
VRVLLRLERKVTPIGPSTVKHARRRNLSYSWKRRESSLRNIAQQTETRWLSCGVRRAKTCMYDHFLFRLLAEFKEHLPIAWSFFAIGTKRPPRKSTARAEKYRSSKLTEENVRELPVLAAMATWIKSHNQQMSGMAAYRQMLLACESATRMVSARALISCHSLCLS